MKFASSKSRLAVGFAFISASLLAAPLAAIAQDEPIGTEKTTSENESASNEVELLPQHVVGRGRDLRGIRVAKPGALLFASFDDDHSFSISMAEINANAEAVFNSADTNNGGSLSIFEQQDWALAIGSHDGPLANAMTFDANLDRQVTLEEFQSGLHRLAKSYMGKDETEIEFSSLLVKPDGKRGPKSKKPKPTDRPS